MPTIESHGLERPTTSDLVNCLSMVLPQDEVDSVLNRARRDLRLPDHLDGIESGDLLRLAHQLTHQRGITAIIARSFMIRLSSYTELAGRTQHA